VLAHGIAESQTFIDGNQRLALVAMLTFLEVNGQRVEASDPSARPPTTAPLTSRQ
jgi:prophage maintenance system killer protein